MVTFILDEGRTAGVLLGLAIGDALGAPLEGMPPPVHPVRDYLPVSRYALPPGRFTDDTLQTLAIAKSLVVCRGFSPHDATIRLLESYREAPYFFGPTSSSFFGLVLSGIPPAEAACEVHRRSGSRTNGSVMRGTPIGLFFGDPVKVYRTSLECSRITHLDPLAGECSAFVNLLVSGMCRGRRREDAFRDAISMLRHPEAKRILPRFAEFIPEPTVDALGVVHCALSVFMGSGSFEEAVVEAVSQGGDADTAGAITGALAGACWGVGEIPDRFVRGLNRAQEILSLTLELWAAAHP